MTDKNFRSEIPCLGRHGISMHPTSSNNPRRTTLLARSICRLKLFELGGIQRSLQLQTLQNYIAAWQPFDNFSYLVAPDKKGLGNYMVWAWDSKHVASHLTEDTESFRLIPEFFFQAPFADGARLLKLSDGYEFQNWKDGQLNASRWWPYEPSPNQLEEAWSQMPSGADHCPEVVPEEPVWLQKPWVQPLLPQGGYRSTYQKYESFVAFAIFLLLIATTSYLIGRGWAANEKRSELNIKKMELKKNASSVLEARNAAVKLNSEISYLASELTYTYPLELFLYMGSVLPQEGVTVKQFEAEGLKVRLVLELSPQLQRAELIKSLQKSGWWTNITESQAVGGSQLTTFEATLSGHRMPVAPTASVSEVDN